MKSYLLYCNHTHKIIIIGDFNTHVEVENNSLSINPPPSTTVRHLGVLFILVSCSSGFVFNTHINHVNRGLSSITCVTSLK